MEKQKDETAIFCRVCGKIFGPPQMTGFCGKLSTAKLLKGKSETVCKNCANKLNSSKK